MFFRFIHIIFSLKFSLITAILFCAALNVSAQKKKKNKKAKQEDPIVEVVLTDEKKTELEHYYLEGEKYYILKDYQKSFAFFERVLEIDPNNAAANYKLSQVYSEKREFDKALPFAIKAMKIGKKNKYYFLQVANLQTNLGQLDQAEKTYSTLVQTIPGTETYLFELAAIQLYQKKFLDAINTYDLAEFHLGTMEEIFIQRQQIYLKQNNLTKAIQEGEKLVENYPDEKSHVTNLARIMVSNNRLTQANTFLAEQIARDPEDDNLYILQAEVYRKQGYPAKALVALQKPFKSPTVDVTAKIRTLAGYLAMLPKPELNEPLLDLAVILVETHPDSYQALAMTGDLYYNTQNHKEARKFYLQAVELDGSNFNIWQNILALDMYLQDYDAVIVHTTKALEIFPNQAALYHFNGTAYLIKKDYENAIRAFNIGKAYAARDNNLNSSFYGQLGDAYNGLGDHQKSDAAYELALKAKPDNDHVLNNYSYFLSLRKTDLEKAKSMSSKLVQTYPDNPTYLDTHAWVLYMMNDFAGAKKYLEEAIKFEPSAVIIEHYGDALFQLGQVDEAIIQWKKALDMAEDPGNLGKKIANRQLYE